MLVLITILVVVYFCRWLFNLGPGILNEGPIYYTPIIMVREQPMPESYMEQVHNQVTVTGYDGMS